MDSTKTVVKANKMPVDKKTKTPAAATATQAATVPTTPVTTKGRKASSKSEVTVPVTSETNAVVAAPVEVRSSDAILTALQETLKALGSDVSSRIREAVKDALEATKAIKREVRDSKKRRRPDPALMNPEERKVWEARRANNAFLKMRPISDELCSFMGLPTKSQRSQTDVTKYVSTYVKAHNCFDPNFKRRILPDAKLAKLLRAKDGQEVTYLNLQSFLKVHFLKPAVPVVVPA
jgi:chromatin remodeling complex protein RSC6